MARRNKSAGDGGKPGRKRWLITCLVFLFWLVLWQAAYRFVGHDLLLASPWPVCRRIAELCGTKAFWQTVFGSLGRILLGFLCAVLAGSLIALLTARFQALYWFFSLPMGIIKATPVASFVILALVWISGRYLSVFVSFLMVLPLIWRNVHDGLHSADPGLLEMARVYRLTPGRTLRAVILPAVLPHFLAAVRVGAGFAWKAGVAGEVIAIPRSAIGTELYHAKVYLETTDLFAWTVVIILLSLLLERGMVCGAEFLAAQLNQ